MTIPSFFIVIPAAFIVALLGVFFVRKSQQKTLTNRQLKKALLKRVEAQPLPKIFQALGISFNKYFHTVPFKNIIQSVQRCETCTSTYQCKNELTNPEVHLSEMEYCQNWKHISQLGQRND